MSNQTPNYNLIKPTPEEFYDIDVQNGNMDIIDAALELVADGAMKTVKVSQSYTDFNNLYENNSVVLYQITAPAATLQNAPSVNNGLLISNGIGNKSQTYITTGTNAIYKRVGTGSWSRFYAEDYKPTVSDVGAAPASHTHTKSQITDFPTSLPASDVYAWAKASTKPSYTAADVGAVPNTRKVNNKALSSDISLTASDVGALPISGGTLSGGVAVNGGYGSFGASNAGNAQIEAKPVGSSGGIRRALQIWNSKVALKTALRIYDEETASAFNVYGEHNSPVASGTYVGTGVSGASNKNSLTFSFVPKVLIVGTANDANFMVMMNGYITRSSTASNTVGKSVVASVSDKTFNWYTTDTSSGATAAQANKSGQTYLYIAIG